MRIIPIILVMPLILCSLGCGGEQTGDPALDPLQLIENVEMTSYNHNPTDYSEVEVGDFYVTLPIDGSIDIYRVSFTMFVVVPNREDGDIETLIEEHMSNVRDRVISTVQRISGDKLHDPDLVWLKTELVEVLRNALGTTEVRDVIFPSFTIERG